jgi:hypothetical protein
LELLQRRIVRLEAFQVEHQLRQNPKFAALSTAGSSEGSNNRQRSAAEKKSLQEQKKKIRTSLLAYYGNACQICRRTAQDPKLLKQLPKAEPNQLLTLAHLVAPSKTSPFLVGYARNFDAASKHNYLLLCGTEGAVGTCHDLWDRKLISLLPAGLNSLQWTVYSPREEHAHLRGLVYFDEDHAIYKRALAWHYARALVLYLQTPGVSMPDRIEVNDLSDSASQRSADRVNFDGSTSAGFDSQISEPFE